MPLRRTLSMWADRYVVTHIAARLFHIAITVPFYGAIAPVRFFLIDDKKMAYMQIAKVANSSITSSLYNIDPRVGNELYRDVKLYDAGKIVPIWEKALPNNKYADYYKFTFVRNPFTRIASCYKDKYIKGKKDIGRSDNQQIPHLYFDAYLCGVLKKDEGFKKFAQKMAKIPLWLADIHFIPQYFHVFDKQGKCRVNYIGKFENLEKDWAYLMNKFNLNPIPHINKTVKDNWMDYYDRETAEIVYRYYEQDIKAFGYEDSYKELMDYISKKESM